MLKSVKKNWKRVLAILIIYTIWMMIGLLFLVWLKGLDAAYKELGNGNHLYITVLYLIVKGVIVYYILIYHLAIPLIKKREWRKKLLQYLLFLAIIIGYEYCLNFKKELSANVKISHDSISNFFLTELTIDFLMILISGFIAILITSNEMRKRKEELEKQKLKAELAAIKYQINPHFLFNSLSFIYTKTIKTNPEAAHVVQLLSDIMSYALDEWDELGTVPLMLEVDHMKKVIEMNQIRFNHKLKINYKEDITVQKARVPTLSLVTLVENAFKHGDLNDENNHLTIELKADNNKIHFLVSNKKKKGPKEPSKGIGLINVQQRLQLMYGIRHSFIIKEDEDFYLNEIIINL